jgi:hypothetical protein
MPADFELSHSEYSDCSAPDDDYDESLEAFEMMARQAQEQQSEWDNV